MADLTTVRHYEHEEIESWDRLDAIFNDNPSPFLNWLFVGTSGVHGTGTKLNDLRHPENYYETDEGLEGSHHVTVLVIQPRTCVLLYGHLPLPGDEEKREARLDWLEHHVRRTLEGVVVSQENNISSGLSLSFEGETKP